MLSNGRLKKKPECARKRVARASSYNQFADWQMLAATERRQAFFRATFPICPTHFARCINTCVCQISGTAAENVHRQFYSAEETKNDKMTAFRYISLTSCPNLVNSLPLSGGINSILVQKQKRDPYIPPSLNEKEKEKPTTHSVFLSENNKYPALRPHRGRGIS